MIGEIRLRCLTAGAKRRGFAEECRAFRVEILLREAIPIGRVRLS